MYIRVYTCNECIHIVRLTLKTYILPSLNDTLKKHNLKRAYSSNTCSPYVQ